MAILTFTLLISTYYVYYVLDGNESEQENEGATKRKRVQKARSASDFKDLEAGCVDDDDGDNESEADTIPGEFDDFINDEDDSGPEGDDDDDDGDDEESQSMIDLSAAVKRPQFVPKKKSSFSNKFGKKPRRE